MLTNRVKQKAFDLGADLVGIADIGRYKHAPIMMSPQGILPEARSVVVMALHHPDGCIEMGGEPHPQVVGPYAVQYTMNQMLDQISFRMGRFLEDLGHRSVPIVSSNIWRYRGCEGLRENFAPDVSHMHAAVAAGLADFGFSGLALTPEFGARNRFVQVITTAALEPDPLLEPGSLCDNCGLCRKHCPSAALVKEISGWNEVRIEDKTYRYANKNLWRCAWGEHFDLDLDLPIPEKVTEAVILEAVEKYGMRGGEFGSCLRFCLPKAIRASDKKYTRAPRRQNKPVPPSAAPDRTVTGRIPALAAVYGCTGILMLGPDKLKAMGITPSRFLPDAVSAVVTFMHTDEEHPRIRQAARQKTEFAAYRIARLLENAGYSVVCHSPLAAADAGVLAAAAGTPYIQTMFTSALLPESAGPGRPAVSSADAPLEQGLKSLAADRGLDFCGISSAERLDALAGQLRPVFDGREVFSAADRNHRFKPYDPEITAVRMHVTAPAEILAGARSAVVLGLGYPVTSAERAGQPPARTVGPYVFGRYEAQFQLTRQALDIVALLESRGHKAVISFDPLGTGGMAGSVRGELFDHFACRFSAWAAGIAAISRAGNAVTSRFGPNQAFIAIITDAGLAPDPLPAADPCGDCRLCVAACPVCAFTNEVTLNLEGRTITFMDRDLNRCDWDKRYALTAESGFGVMGSPLDIKPPAELTAADLAAALRQHDPVTKYRPSVAEQCVLACPLGRLKER